MKLAIVGTGYVGLVSGACFAELGHDVVCVDIDKEKIDNLKKGIIPIYEPGLDEMVKRNIKAGRIHFTTSIPEATKSSEIIFIAVGTPPRPDGSADLSYVENVAREIAQNMNKYTIIVEKSTVPVETGEQVQKTVKENNVNNVEFDVVSNPEFLREGTAIHDTMHPDRIVIGVSTERAAEKMKSLYSCIKAPVLVTDIKSAELIKHASNSFLSMKISFINAIARLCDITGADVNMVADGMGMDKRIGRSFLNAGIGYGGFCLSGEEVVFLGNPTPKLMEFKDSLSLKNKPKVVALSFDGEKTNIADVQFVTKRNYSGEMVRVNTAMGRSLEVTSDHPMVVAKNETLITKAAGELKDGEEIPVILNLPVKPTASIDVLDNLPDSLKKIIKLRPKNKNLSDYKKQILAKLKCEPWRKSDFLRKNYLTYSYYLALQHELSAVEMMLFTSKGNTTYFPASIDLNEEFWRLVGYYLAEGHIHHEKAKRGIRSRVIFTFNVKEKEYVDDVCEILSNLGVRFLRGKYSNTARITVSSKIFAYLLENILGCGTDSYTAKSPDFIFLQEELAKKALLCGLFRGDGYPYFHKKSKSVTLEFGTCSKLLAHGVMLLLQSLKIMPSYKIQFMKKSTVPAHIIRVSGKSQVRKLMFFDSETNKKIDAHIKDCREIKPIGYRIKNNLGFLKINKIEKFFDNRRVYSMELFVEPHLFVASGGILVHNCFPKDVEAFIHIAKKNGYDFNLLQECQNINEEMRKYFVKKVEKELWIVKDKTIGILGLAFKPNTDDMRFAPSIDIINALHKEGAKIKAYDPVAMEKAKPVLPEITYCKDAYDAAKDCDLLLIVTEWNEFKEMDLEKIKSLMKFPKIVDGRNIFEPKRMHELGFKYVCIGRH